MGFSWIVVQQQINVVQLFHSPPPFKEDALLRQLFWQMIIIKDIFCKRWSRQNIQRFLAISSEKMSELNIVSWWRNGAPEAPCHIWFSTKIFKFCPSVTHHSIHWMNEMLEPKTFYKNIWWTKSAFVAFVICFNNLF